MKNSSTPFTRLSAAISLDGKLYHETDPTLKFGSPRDLRRLMDLRAKSDTIVIGTKTLLADPDSKTSPCVSDPEKKPLNVLCSSKLDVNLHLPFFHTPQIRKKIITTEFASAEAILKASELAEVFVTNSLNAKVNLNQAFSHLYESGSRNILLEGGGLLNHSALCAGLINELHITLCPTVLAGFQNSSLFQGPPLSLAKNFQFELISCEKVANELFLVYSRP